MADPAGVHTRAVRIRPSEVASRRTGDEIVILDLASATYHGLNAAGALLWERLVDWRTTDELTAVLIDSFGLTAPDATRDVDHFVDGCAAAGLLEVRTQP